MRTVAAASACAPSSFDALERGATPVPADDSGDRVSPSFAADLDASAPTAIDAGVLDAGGGMLATGCDTSCDAWTSCVDGGCVGEPGCADGTREAFEDRAVFARVAGCGALWPRSSLRYAPIGSPCGNELGLACSVAADACAAGWHVCGVRGANEIRERVSLDACRAQIGRWAIALGDYSCEDCGTHPNTGAACCGDGCTPSKGSCVYEEATAWFGFIDGHTNSCGEIENLHDDRSHGVMCCRDAAGAP